MGRAGSGKTIGRFWWLHGASPYQKVRRDLVFFLNDLVDFGCAVKQQRRLQREHEQANQATEQATNRQTIEDESSKKGDEKRLSRLFTYEFFRLGYHFGKLVLGVAHAAQCNVSVFVHNFVSVARAALRVLIPLAQRQPRRAGAAVGRKLNRPGFSMKAARSTRCFQAIPRHHFQSASVERGTVGRKQNPAIAISYLQRRHDQALEIRFDLERFSAV